MKKFAFTLIELSIVLVIIGLIVGGVLVGRDLISAADVRAQVSQIEKYRTAVNTFRLKYGYLPGDMPNAPAVSYGFKTRVGNPGMGDGNGVIQGTCNGSACSEGGASMDGEAAMFWVDLSTANLIDGSFNTAVSTNWSLTLSGSAIDDYLPKARIGGNNYISIFNGTSVWGYLSVGDSTNWYSLAANPSVSGWQFNSTPGLSVMDAYNIDTKIDDGMPQSGKAQALYNNYTLYQNYPMWAAGGGVQGARLGGWESLPTTAATIGTATTCYDNSANPSGTPGIVGAQHYSTEMNNGTGINCALSFRF